MPSASMVIAMVRRYVFILGLAAGTTQLVPACVPDAAELNPQPLPPKDSKQRENEDDLSNETPPPALPGSSTGTSGGGGTSSGANGSSGSSGSSGFPTNMGDAGSSAPDAGPDAEGGAS